MFFEKIGAIPVLVGDREFGILKKVSFNISFDFKERPLYLSISSRVGASGQLKTSGEFMKYFLYKLEIIFLS